MSKTIILTRHGEAENVGFNTKDFERELTTRGKAEAERIGNHLRNKNLSINKIIHSSAKRTNTTATIIHKQLSQENLTLISEHSLYLCTREKIEDIILEYADNEDEAIMIIGHNNGISDYYNYINKNSLYHTLSTCETAIITINVDRWEDIYNTNITLVSRKILP